MCYPRHRPQLPKAFRCDTSIGGKGKGKGKVTPLQARLWPRGGQRYSTTLPRTRRQKKVSGQRHAPAAIYPRERPGTHCTGGWVGPRAGLDDGKTRPHRDSIPEPSSPQSVAIPTELPGPQSFKAQQLFHVPPGLTFRILHGAQITFKCSVWTFTLYSVNRWVTKVKNVYFAVGTESLYKPDTFRL